MRLKILYDNESEEGFISGWGFSCLIETGKRTILFDTGWDGNILLHNMDKLGVIREEIDTIVISHEHWDHLGGLTYLLHPEVDVYEAATVIKTSHLLEREVAILEMGRIRKLLSRRLFLLFTHLYSSRGGIHFNIVSSFYYL